ncbi:MAG: response regulator [Leptospiraceae bacterium]
MAFAEIQNQAMIQGLIYGATLILFLYNVFLAISTRDSIYLNYSALSISVLFYQLLLFHGTSLGFQSRAWHQLLVVLTILLATGVLGTHFLRQLLALDPASGADRLARASMLAFAILMVFVSMFRQTVGPYVYALGLIPVVLFGYISADRARLGSKTAAAVFLGLLIALVSGTAHQWIEWQAIRNSTTQLILPLGALGTLLLFSVGLGLRIRSIRLEALTGRNRAEFLKNLLEASPFPVMVLRKPFSEPIFWNQAAQNQYELNSSWSLASHLSADVAEPLNREIEGGDLDRRLVTVNNQAGRTLETAISVRRIKFEGQAAFLHLHVDRTAELQTRRGLEREQLALQEAVDELQKTTQQRDDFIAAMSHEIRTPMSGILSAADLLQESNLIAEAPAGSSGKISGPSVLQVLQRNALRLLHLLNDILDFARIQAGRMDPDPHRFSLHDFAQSSIDKLEPLLSRANLKLEYVHSGNGDEVLRGDAARMRQILERFAFSLLSSRRDGTIRVNSYLTPDRRLHFEVSLDGRALVGADPKLIQRIAGSPYGYRPRTGRELSLAVARGLIKTLGGHLEISETTDSALSMSVSFPVEIEAHQSARKMGAELPLNLLVFEDNADNAVLMKRILEKRGYRVHIASSAAEGLEILKNDRPDLVLMDLHLPDMDGFQTTQEIQKSLGKEAPPVAALSASTMERDRLAAQEVGMVGFLTKPIQKEQFESLIQELFS